MSKLEQQAEERIQQLVEKFAPIANYRREYIFHPVRKWRFDFAWPDKMVAIEVNGGTWVSGRHNHSSSIEKDYHKYNEAALLGWRVFSLTGNMLKGGELERVLLQTLL